MALRRAADSASQTFARVQADVAESALETHVTARDVAWTEFQAAVSALRDGIAAQPHGMDWWLKATETEQHHCKRLQVSVVHLEGMLKKAACEVRQGEANDALNKFNPVAALTHWKAGAEMATAAIAMARSSLKPFSTEVEEETAKLCRAELKPQPAALKDIWKGDAAMAKLGTALKTLCQSLNIDGHSLPTLVAALPYLALKRAVGSRSRPHGAMPLSSCR